MDELVEKILRKAKKPISKDNIYLKIENILSKENDGKKSLSNDDKQNIDLILENGVSNYTFIKTNNNNYISILKTSFHKGRFYASKNGEGRVVVTNSYKKGGKLVVQDEEYVVKKENVCNAIDGDVVLIDTYMEKGSKVFRGKIIRIIDRQLNSIVGEVFKMGNSYFVRPIDKRKNNVIVSIDGDVIEGQRVVVSIDEQTNDDFYVGTVTHIFNKYDPEDDILWEALKCGITSDFSKDSLEQIKGVPSKVLDSDKIGRCDLTDWEIFTIDGRDTKDIDDALSFKKLDNGNSLVGVHIADVSYYVEEDSFLDKDAFSRGTSAYLAGKVIPMLPKELSNGICSLNPGVERLAISCMMEIDSGGNVVHHEIWRSVIKSNIQMTYDAVNAILKHKVVEKGYENYVQSIIGLNQLALLLRNNRVYNGSIEFDRPELEVQIDDVGKVSGFSIRTQDLAENLIEEFMLLANETIDKHLSDQGIPCLHRVHDIPSVERLTEFMNLLNIIGYGYDKYSAKECCCNNKYLQDLANYIKKTGTLSYMLSTHLVRCMSRAKYSNINIGHHGLAKSNYCHFTSPIRRYSDLVVHRILKDCVLNPCVVAESKDKWKKRLPDIAIQTSKMERAADEAEMQTLYMRCAEYMHQYIGKDFVGTIIGIGSKGLQIQLDNYIEGKVRFRNLIGEYSFNPETYSLVSLDGQEDYHIGDRLSLKVVSSDKNTKIIDFKINEKLGENIMKGVYSKNQLVKRRYFDV